MSLFFPQDPAAWNGRVWVMAHGAGSGTDRAWDAGLGGNGARGAGAYNEELLQRGFGVAVTRRAANAVALGRNANPPPTGIRRYSRSAPRWITSPSTMGELHQRLHRRRRQVPRAPAQRLPTRRYFYGHSAGARICRGMNYTAGLKQARRWQAVLRRHVRRRLRCGHVAAGCDEGWQGRALHNRRREGAAMVPQLEVAHQGNNNIWPTKRPEWVSASDP